MERQKTDTLIRTKLRLPFTRPELVPRPRLQAQIVQGLRGPLERIRDLNLTLISVTRGCSPARHPGQGEKPCG